MQIRLRTALQCIATLFLFLTFTLGAQAQSLPIDVSLSLSDDTPALGQQMTATLEVTPSINLYDAVIHFETEGGITPQNGGQVNVGSISEGETASYSVSIQLEEEGEAVIHGGIEAAKERGAEKFGDFRSYYFLIYQQQTYVSPSSFIAARIDSLDQATGKAAKSPTYLQKLQDIATIKVTPDTTTKKIDTTAHRKSSEVIVGGQVTWTDREDNQHGLRFSEVEIIDSGGNVLASGQADEDGNYSISLQTSNPIDIKVRVTTATEGFKLYMTGGNVLYRAESTLQEDISPGQSFPLNLAIGKKRAFSVHASLVESSEYVKELEGSFISPVNVVYPHNVMRNGNLHNGSFYCGSTILDFELGWNPKCIFNETIYIDNDDGHDWDVIHHEFGHYVQDIFDISKSPGGSHCVGDNLSEERCLQAVSPPNKSEGTRLAWGEGWATYFALSLQKERNLVQLGINPDPSKTDQNGNPIPEVGDLRYTDKPIGGGQGLEIKIERFDSNGINEDNEIAVQRVLWDIYDGKQESKDDIELSASDLWTVVKDEKPETLSDVVSALKEKEFNNTSSIAELGAILAKHRIAPAPIRPSANKELPPDGAGTVFEWDTNGGGSAFRNDEFRVQFWSRDFSQLLHESPLITTSSTDLTATYTPSAGVFLNDIFGNYSEVKWLVVGKQTDSPETGPYVSPAKTITRAQDCPALTASISNLDGQLNQVPGFPTVFAGIDVEENGNPALSFDRRDFSISEQGQLITNFGFNQPSQSGSRLADIVFIVDNSGSMGGEQGDVERNIRTFVDALIANNVDFALGLTRYGQSGRRGRPIIENNGVLVQDANQFKNDILSRNRTSGGREPGYNAIVQSASQFAFRPGSKKIFVIATDESPDQGYSSQGDALSALTNNDITLYASTRSFLNGRFRSLTDATGGQIFGIRQDFSSVANSITSQVSSTYILSYLSPTPFLGGVVGNSREVTVSVSGQDCAVTARDNYVPGNVPLVKPTTATSNLSNQAQPNNANLTISASIATFSGPSIQSAQLFYRTASSSSVYSSVSMQPVSNASSSVTAKGSSKAAPVLYEATIPASDVQSPGLNYYITVSDGQSTVTTPSTDPQSNPLQVAVLPNEPPQIAHTKPTTLLPKDPVRIGAEVTDATNALTSVNMFYRQRGQITYTELTMDNPSGDTYRATIPGEDVTEFGIEYYIQATDDFGVSNTIGTADNPVLVEPSAPCVASDFTEVVNDAERRVEITVKDANGISSASFTDDQGNPFLNNLEVSLVSATDQNGNPVDFARDTPGDDVFWSAGGANSQPAEVVMHLKQADPSVAEAGYFLRTTNDCGVTTVIDPPHNFEMEVAPAQFSLDGNYPNPFSGRTTFQIGVPAREHVTLTVYDVMGRRVATVLDKAVPAGTHQITWQGQSKGQPLSSGIYFYRIEAGDFVQTRRMTLVR